MPIQQLQFTLGDYSFLDFEVPERLSELGGHQIVAQHDFPGGLRTQQLYGAFPSEIRWQGMLTGTDALARMRDIDRIRIAGEEVTLSYGDTALVGIVTEFLAEPRHQWLVQYKILFQPRLDLSAFSQQDDLLETFHDILNAIAHLATIVELIIPAGGGTSYPPLPLVFLPLASDFIDLSNAALQLSQGALQDLTAATLNPIYASANTLLATANTFLLTNTDPIQTSPVLDMSSYVNVIVAGFQNPVNRATTTLNVINPNLPQLASQYYGDATKWQKIATASSIVPPDPFPIGGFTLTIPP